MFVTRNPDLFFFSMIPIGATPLIYAVLGGIVYTVSYLLDHGANPDKPNEQGRAPLHLAVEQGPFQCIWSLILCMHSCTPLFFYILFVSSLETCK